jgi:hypothetical protein
MLFLLRVGCFVEPSIIRIQDDRHFFFFYVVRNCLFVFVFFLVLNLVLGPLGPHTSFLLFFLFFSLPFRGIRVGNPTNLEGGSGRSGPDLLLF